MNHRRSSSRSGLGLTAILLAVAAGCVASGPKPPTAEELAGRDARSIILAPLNVASSLPVEIEASSEIVSTTLVKYLEEHGKSVRKLSFQVGRELWVNATQQASRSKQRRSFEIAAGFYAREIAKQVDYDVLIIPTLYIQNADVRSRFVKWDGAREPIRIVGMRVLNRHESFDRMTAPIRAASIMAAVFSSDGTAIQSKAHGLQVIEHVQLEEGKGVRRGDRSFSIEWNSPPLDDPLKIRSGIAASLAPFLPELEAPLESGEPKEAEPE